MYTVFDRRSSIQFEIVCDRNCCMKDSLCPRECSRDKDSNDTKNETKKQISRSVTTWQRFVTRVGVFTAVGETRVKTGAGRVGLKYYARFS